MLAGNRSLPQYKVYKKRTSFGIMAIWQQANDGPASDLNLRDFSETQTPF